MNSHEAEPKGPRSRQIDEYNFDSVQCARDRRIDPGNPSVATRLVRGLVDIPALDIAETSDVLEFIFELPGVDENDLEIAISRHTLAVRGEKAVTSSGDRTWHHRETSPRCFERIVLLPEDLDHEDVATRMRNGVLTIKIAKLEKQSKKSQDDLRNRC